MTDTSNSINTLPNTGASFIVDLRTYLQTEAAKRFNLMFASFVQTGGTHATGAGLTKTPASLVAFPGGYYITETNSVTYADDKANIWLICHKDTTTVVGGNWVRTSGTHYLTDSVSSSQPTTPADSTILLRIVTSGGSVTTATDLRTTAPVPTSTSVSIVDETDTNATKDKLVSNLLAKGWEDHKGAGRTSHSIADVNVSDSNATKNKLVSNSLATDWENAKNGEYTDLLFTQQSTPSNPASSKNKIYFKSDNDPYILNSAGLEELLVVTPSKTKGDIYTFSTIDARLGIGTNDYLLVPASGETTGLKWQENLVVQTIYPRGYIDGFNLRNDTDTDHDIEFGIGAALNTTGARNIVLTSVMTKRIDAVWAANDNSGGLFSSTVTTATWYYCFVIYKTSDGSIDAGFDTSSTAANIPSGYVEFRRVGAVFTDGSSNIIGFTQTENGLFEWDDPPLDVSVSNQGDTAATRTLTVPPVVGITAKMNLYIAHSSATRRIYISSLNADDETPSNSNPPLGNITFETDGNEMVGPIEVKTNSSGQIRTRANGGSTTVRIATLGWIDTRGKDA